MFAFFCFDVHDYTKRSILFVVGQTEDTSVNVGEELVGPLDKCQALQVLNRFYTTTQMKELAKEHGLDGTVPDNALDTLHPFF